MATKKVTGAKTLVTRGEFGTQVSAAGEIADSASKWYRIDAKADALSGLPSDLPVGCVFKATASNITLTDGDIVTPIDTTYLCHTSVDFSAEEGTVDVTDSCSDGWNEMILDGFAGLSGTFNSFVRFVDGGANSGKLSNADDILGRFMDKVDDEATDLDGYTYTARANEAILLMICLNKDAAVGEYQQWLVVPAIISATGGIGGGIKDALSQDVTWTKAEGKASRYSRKTLAGDVISL